MRSSLRLTIGLSLTVVFVCLMWFALPYIAFLSGMGSGEESGGWRSISLSKLPKSTLRIEQWEPDRLALNGREYTREELIVFLASQPAETLVHGILYSTGTKQEEDFRDIHDKLEKFCSERNINLFVKHQSEAKPINDDVVWVVKAKAK